MPANIAIVNKYLNMLPLPQLRVQNGMVSSEDLHSLILQILTTTPGYKEDSFSGNYTGFASSIPVTVRYWIVGSLAFIQLPGGVGVSTGTTFTLTGVPTELVPTNSNFASIALEDNSLNVTGWVELLASTNVLTFGKVPGTSGGFTNANNKGIPFAQIIIIELD